MLHSTQEYAAKSCFTSLKIKLCYCHGKGLHGIHGIFVIQVKDVIIDPAELSDNVFMVVPHDLEVFHGGCGYSAVKIQTVLTSFKDWLFCLKDFHSALDVVLVALNHVHVRRYFVRNGAVT